MDAHLASAWGDWLSGYPWQAWATLTFRDPGYSHEAATRSFARWVRHLRRDSPGVGYFVGHEVGRLGRLHLHALVGGLREYEALGGATRTIPTRREAWRWWFDRYGRAQVLPYEPELGAAHYVAKYVAKELAHYDIQNPDRRCLAPRGTGPSTPTLNGLD